MAAPRIFCLTAARAPVVAVFRRGPTNWAHVGRWWLDRPRYEPGAWLGGRLFPRRSDLSPDGRYLCYFAHKPNATWEHGEAYVAVSRLPWLTALHVFATCGTWTCGYHFTEAGEAGEPQPIALPTSYGLRATRAVQFATERRRGWIESPDSPPRVPGDAWDERRLARIQKAQPRGQRLLCAERVEQGADDVAVDGVSVKYWIEADGDIELLPDVQWADWDADGRLLVATRSGRLQIVSSAAGRPETVFEEDLSQAEPRPEPPPTWAGEW